eukprot:gene24171-29000_t
MAEQAKRATVETAALWNLCGARCLQGRAPPDELIELVGGCLIQMGIIAKRLFALDHTQIFRERDVDAFAKIDRVLQHARWRVVVFGDRNDIGIEFTQLLLPAFRRLALFRGCALFAEKRHRIVDEIEDFDRDIVAFARNVGDPFRRELGKAANARAANDDADLQFRHIQNSSGGTFLKPKHFQVTSACTAVNHILARVGDKWTVLVIHYLGNGSMRFNELKRTINGISQKMLTSTLRGLERDGFVTRTVYPTIPPRVDYELTDLGRELLVPVRGLADFAIQNEQRIANARARFDNATGVADIAASFAHAA